jgi:hypothetical protein
MLFPWARSEVYRYDMSCAALAPAWTQWARIGPWLRGEKDKRLYRNVFSNKGYVAGLRKSVLLATRRRIHESDPSAGRPLDADGCIVQFRGMEKMFQPFASRRALVQQRIHEATRSWILQTVSAEWPTNRSYIGVHLRRGDFEPWDPSRTRGSLMSMRLPSEWFVKAIQRARSLIGRDVEALVFTDCRGEDLDVLLREPNTRLAADAPALCHLFALANARAIVCSASSFSMWSAFLSDAPAIWFPGVAVPPRPAPAVDIVDAFGVA